MLEAVGIRKIYPGTVALDDVSIRFDAGKVHALLGKNGAGKSTLVKILAGTTPPSAGQILIDGRPVTLHSATDAFTHGIATVHQELSLIPGLTVAENILLGRLPRRGCMIDWKAARTRARQVLDEMDVQINVNACVKQLGAAQQQVIEIAKAMSFQPKVLMLDEPTSSLARHESEMLFAVIRRLAAKGVAVIHITHRLQELTHIADVVTVLRDGKCVGTVPMIGTPPDQIVRMIFGEVMQNHRPPSLPTEPSPSLEVRHLSQRQKLHDISFTLNRGEILGIAGMVGAGRTELLRALFGADPIDAGQILLDGHAPRHHTVRAMKRLGAALIPENRKEQSLILPLSTNRNLCLASLGSLARCGTITTRREHAITHNYTHRLAIKVADIDAPITSLSGGNQQKVVVAKWLNTRPRVMLFDEPTRGIDLHAKQQIFQIIWDLSAAGIGSLFVSSEFEELVEVCHRILIMKAGRIVDQVPADQITVEQLVVRCMADEAPTASRGAA